MLLVGLQHTLKIGLISSQIKKIYLGKWLSLFLGIGSLDGWF